jgi:hypothetical protein
MNLKLNIHSARDLVRQRFHQPHYPNLHSISNSSGRRTDLNENKMAVVNLEAALTTWKSIHNHKVNQASEAFRCNLASKLRLSPAHTGLLPNNLMRHSLG